MTIITTNSVSSNMAIGAPENEVGLVRVAYGSLTVQANFTAGDVFKWCLIPAGASVFEGYVIGTLVDKDTTTEFDADIGWEGNDTGFGNLGAWIASTALKGTSAASLKITNFRLGGTLTTVPQTFESQTTVTLKINTIAETYTGEVTLRIFLYYSFLSI